MNFDITRFKWTREPAKYTTVSNRTENNVFSKQKIA